VKQGYSVLAEKARPMLCVGMARSSRFSWLVISWLLGSPAAVAQFHRATDPVASPASSLILQDDALAVDVNPAALGQLQSWSVAYLHSEVDQDDSWLGRGDALYFATPVFGPLSVGVSLQSIRPGADAARPPDTGDADRAQFALALALAPSAGFSFGIATRAFSSGNTVFDGLTALDAGLLLRPSRWLSVGLIGRDLFVSRDGFGTAGLDLGSSVLLSLGLRPFPGEYVTFNAELVSRLESPVDIGARGGISVAVPYVGNASGIVEVERLGDESSALRVMAELAVHAGGATVAGGGTFGDGLGDEPGWYGLARIEGAPRAGVQVAGRVLDIEIPQLSARGMIVLGLALERARTEPAIAGVLLRPRGSDMGLAYAQELRIQIQALRAAGKHVVCHLDSASGAEYYACAAADRILLDPAGDIRLLGLSSSMILIGETLERIGVRADIVRIGPYKSAPEQLTQRELSDAAREQVNTMLDDAQRRMYGDLAADLHVSRQRIADIVDEAPYLAHSAIRERLIKAAVDEYELEDGSLDLFGGRGLTRELPRDARRSWGKEASIGIIVIDDEIVDGESVEVPLVGVHMSGSETIIRELDQMGRDPSIRAIVLRVDSPGGAALGSDKIWRAVRRVREQKPVVASMGAVAASGGYYIASAADEIWAAPSTLTGSIGVFTGKVDLAQLADKLGVHIENFQRGKRAGGESLYRPFTDDERAALTEALRTYYRLFLSRVAEGRKMSVEAVDAVARGRVHSGDTAQSLGLVDRLGGLVSALIRARQLADLGPQSGVVVRPVRKTGLLDFVVGDAFGMAQVASEDELHGRAEGAPPVLPRELRSLVRTMIAAQQLGAGTPLALLPFDLDLR
jgi:protease IV